MKTPVCVFEFILMEFASIKKCYISSIVGIVILRTRFLVDSELDQRIKIETFVESRPKTNGRYL